ncbi:Ubiquitin homeostasis protein [Podosphaera aphanis]|nr:Ubiquitin homeostasis protein [Podosphaera aphanis]
MTEYKLSASLPGHESDVRSVLFPTPGLIISASRDKTTRLWKQISENKSTYEVKIASKSGHWLNALTHLPPNNDYPDGLVFAGGKDLIVEVRQPSKMPEDNADALLIGHSNAICSLDIAPSGKFVVSGAWDNKAIMWPIGKWECESVLDSHEGSVWAVLAWDDETIITGCADQKIRIFHKSGKLLNSFQASKGPVRALCRLSSSHPSGGDFASADNEGVIRFWKLSGKKVGEGHGHESFIYSVASLPSGEVVSSGEDRTLRIWRGNDCIQTITHPAVSVWSVAVCPETGDLVTGASDAIVRVFTRNPDRVADQETLKYFENAVKSSAIPKQTMPEINKEKLPGPEFLNQKSGTKDGQVQMILESNGSVTAHTWSMAMRQWNPVGTVVDAVGSSGQKQVHDGKEYDYVFDVDMEDGKPPLKLPYNLSENPYDAATRFIKVNEAPVSYLEQVANFIIQNTQGATISQTPQDNSTDEFKSGTTEESPKILPQSKYLGITVARIPAIQKKIRELNSTLMQTQKTISLNPTELSVLDSLCAKLDKSPPAAVSQGEIGFVIKLITEWPYKDRLPGLDLLRLISVMSQTAKYKKFEDNLIDIILVGAAGEKPSAENHVMMALRTFANLFETIEGRILAQVEFEKVHGLILASISETNNRNLLVAATTVYINYAVLSISENTKVDFDQSSAILDALVNIIKKQSDSEVIYRALVALGTFLGSDKDLKTAAIEIFDSKSVLNTAMAKASDPRIRKVGREALDLLP